MFKIEITQKFQSKEDLIDALRVIALQIKKGYNHGINSWELKSNTEKQEKIDYIKRVLSDWGSVSTADLELDSSPMYNSIGSNHVMLIEAFNVNYVRVVEYVHETETDETDVSYDNLSDDLIDEISYIMEGYEADMQKTLKRTQN